jgi:hypothetical protein
MVHQLLMRNTLILLLAVATLTGLQFMMSETLVNEDGSVMATSLPLDKQTSEVAYESATFGMG